MRNFFKQLRYIKCTLILWLIAILSYFLGYYKIGLTSFILSYFFGLHSISTYSKARIIRIIGEVATIGLWIYSSLETSNEVMSKSISGFITLIILLVISIIIFLFSIFTSKKDFIDTNNKNKHPNSASTKDIDGKCKDHCSNETSKNTKHENIQINNITHNFK